MGFVVGKVSQGQSPWQLSLKKENKCYLAFFVMLCSPNTARGNISHFYKTAKSLLCILLTCQEAFEMVVVFKLDNVKEFMKLI
jgi:hypothetical protein